MPKRANWRTIKRHRNYSVDEVARCLGRCKGTIRLWMKNGLLSIDDQRPALIHGAELIRFLKDNAPTKQKCKLQQCYCFSCRRPKSPAFDEMEYYPITTKGGNLRALCEKCSTVMHKRIARSNLSALAKSVAVTIVQNRKSAEQATTPLSVSTKPSLNDHLKRG